MAISNSVQFVGAPRVLDAYQKRGVAKWAMFCNKQFLFKYDGDSMQEGVDELQSYLQMLGDSVAVMTLQVYEDMPAKTKIKSNTPCDGSFNFRINSVEGSQGFSPHMVLAEQYKRERDESRAELLSMRDRLEELEENESKEGGGMIGAIQQAIMPHLGQIIAGLFQPSHYNTSAVPGALGNAPDVAGDVAPVPVSMQSMAAAPVSQAAIDERELERLGAAYAVLRNNYPSILQVLEKLANVSMADPDKFKLITSYFAML